MKDQPADGSLASSATPDTATSDGSADFAAMLELVRGAVPPHAEIVVASGGDTSLVDALAKEGRPVCHFPGDGKGNYLPGPMADGDVAIQQLEWMRFNGARYLAASESVLAWLRGVRKFKYHLDTYYTWVARSHAGVVYSLWKSGDPGSLPGRDKLPMPPPHIIYLVASHYSPEKFYKGGEADADAIRQLLEPRRGPMESTGALLDFGCGCGRVIRHWAGLTNTRVCGSDYNPLLIDWCHKKLRFAKFQVNGFAAPLDWPDETFDVVYTISIFTHLDAAAQAFWMRELSRVMKRGGHLIVSVHGRANPAAMSPEQRTHFEAGEMVVCKGEHEGSNACHIYHPEAYVRNVMAGHDLRLVEFAYDAIKGAQQDAAVFQKI